MFNTSKSTRLWMIISQIIHPLIIYVSYIWQVMHQTKKNNKQNKKNKQSEIWNLKKAIAWFVFKKNFEEWFERHIILLLEFWIQISWFANSCVANYISTYSQRVCFRTPFVWNGNLNCFISLTFNITYWWSLCIVDELMFNLANQFQMCISFYLVHSAIHKVNSDIWNN